MWIAANQPHPTTHPRHQLPRKSLPSGLGICCSSLFENDAHFVWREGCGSDIFELCLIPFAKTWCSQRIMPCKGTKRTGIDMAGACKLQTLRPLGVTLAGAPVDRFGQVLLPLETEDGDPAPKHVAVKSWVVVTRPIYWRVVINP